ncbi:hypothetical protein LRY65_04970 [Candidatus Woesebacteria bacterium]|nr:hypothetical protein [Candidatus Woesebacteria bacterium]MCD8506859.1 hypothetical protein [Candidatus Woesebacteria bacterium]MCD8527521.1 hypothetical protein [Candidatus Woesebacteria bacterium]MCD8546261.1 hypothetical protein [Candidatus Woesebacteria bacterium]
MKLNEFFDAGHWSELQAQLGEKNQLSTNTHEAVQAYVEEADNALRKIVIAYIFAEINSASPRNYFALAERKQDGSTEQEAMLGIAHRKLAKLQQILHLLQNLSNAQTVFAEMSPMQKTAFENAENEAEKYSNR